MIIFKQEEEHCHFQKFAQKNNNRKENDEKARAQKKSKNKRQGHNRNNALTAAY